MTSRPRRVPIDRTLLPGLAAIALFGLLAAVILAGDFSAILEGRGFPADASVVGSIGAALIGLEAAIPTESFVVALIVIAIALDAALDGSIMLAKREPGERSRGDPVTDGGADEDDTGDSDDAQGGER